MPNKNLTEYARRHAINGSGEYKLAALLYKGGAILRIACNSHKSLGYRRKYFWHGDATRHAELNAIHAVPRDVIEGCSLLVVRVNAKGEFTSAKPCFACAKALYDSNIRRVHYSNYDGDIVKLDLVNIDFNNYEKEKFTL